VGQAQRQQLSDIPRILGWGHHTAPLEFATKVAESRDNTYVLPHTRRRSSMRSSALKSRQCRVSLESRRTTAFTTSEYMAIDHFGITKPGDRGRRLKEGVIELGGKLPINPSGGLIGAGHPVGATRRASDARLPSQITDTAGEYQLKARRSSRC